MSTSKAQSGNRKARKQVNGDLAPDDVWTTTDGRAYVHDAKRVVHPADVLDVHDHLVNEYGRPVAGAASISTIREHIAGMPKTAATFRARSIDDVDESHVHDVHVEHLRGWRCPPYYPASRSRKYVNPGYVHAHTYADVYVECACGAIVTSAHPGEWVADATGDHAPDCDEADRVAASERLEAARTATIERLTRIGWTTVEMAPRLGFETPSAVTRQMQRSGLSLDDLREEYRRLAANTYRLFRIAGVEAAVAASPYPHRPDSLAQWFRERGDLDEAMAHVWGAE